MEKNYLLSYSDTDVRKYTSIEQLVYAVPGIIIKGRYVDPVEGCMIFKLNCSISQVALMKVFLEEAGMLKNVELYEERSLEW